MCFSIFWEYEVLKYAILFIGTSAVHYQATMLSILLLANIVEYNQWKDLITLLCHLFTIDNKFFNYLLITTSCYPDLRIYNTLIELEDNSCMRNIKCKDIMKTDDFITLYKNITNGNCSVCLSEVFKRMIAGRTHWVEDIAVSFQFKFLFTDMHVVMARNVGLK